MSVNVGLKEVSFYNNSINKDKFYVYEHMNKINGKIYIGITKLNPKKRWNKGKGYIENKDFYNDIVRYGWDNFEHNILIDNLDIRTAQEIESLLIYKLDTTNKEKGYNLICDFSLKTYQPTKTILRRRNVNAKRCRFDGREYESITDLVKWLYENEYIEWKASSSMVSKWIEGKSPMPVKMIGKELRILE